MLQVPLHDGVFQRRIDRGAEHPWIRVPHSMHSDPNNEIELDAAVPKFDQRAISKPARDVGEVRRRPSGLRQAIELSLVGRH